MNKLKETLVITLYILIIITLLSVISNLQEQVPPEYQLSESDVVDITSYLQTIAENSNGSEEVANVSA